MWTCVKCEEEVEDNFTECWNCRADRDGVLPDEGELSAHEVVAAENRAATNKQLSSINCLRCDKALEYRGMVRIHHSQSWLMGELIGQIFAEDLEMYICPRCGRAEFFAPGFQQ